MRCAATTEHDEGDRLADVLPLYPERDLGDDDALVRVDPKQPCYHRHTRLERESRRVFCRHCDAEVDPFSVLQTLAAEVERWVTFRKEQERRAKAAQGRLDETLRLERNARARLKKLDPSVELPERPWGEASP